MKKLILLPLLFLSQIIISQPWTTLLPQNKSRQDLTLFDYRKAFTDYWAPYQVVNGEYTENGVTRKAAGWKQFKRWEYEMETKVNPVTGKFPEKSAGEIFREWQGDHPLMPLGAWTPVGPSSSTGGYAGIGRINCIGYHPSNNNIYWVGAASGGLWVTTDNGVTWSCLTDANSALAVSDIIIPSDYASSGTIYIATGDKDHWDNRSVGVLKSTNGGSSWSSTALSYTLSQGKMVYRLLLHPTNNQIMVAATSNGVYKTTDGGTTWSTQLTTTVFVDMEYKPGDFNTIYGSTTSGTIYRTTNGGTTWTQVYSDAGAQRIELAVSPNQPTWVYAIAADLTNGLYGIFKSTDSGATFPQVFAGTTSNMLGYNSNGSGSGGQGWYDLSLASSPSNASVVLLGGVNTWRSTNGGTSWSIVNHWWGDGVPAVHADKHSLSFRSNGDLFECNDGGVYLSTNNGTTWTDKTNTMVISQMYKLGVSATVFNEVIAGLQDNGTKLWSGGAWSDVKGGDGMECLIDYTNVNIQYGTYVNGQISRTINHWLNTTNIQPSAAGSGAWVTPYIIDPVNPLILYAGYADVWKTTDRGDNWTKISTMATTNKIRAMAIAPTNTQVLYVSDPTNLWKTANGGTSWTSITGTLPVTSGSITSICVKNDDPNTVWVTLSGYNANTVFQSTDGGTTWTNFAAGLPQIPAYSIVQNKQSVSEVQLYAGTEVGVYFKKGANNWVLFNTGLPNVKIGEVEISYHASPQNSKLRVATYGRGLWETLVYYSSTAMTYNYSNVFQQNTSTVAPNQADQEIIGIEINTAGDLTPLSVTSFTFNTTGCTNPATDISTARLYYTGQSNSFAKTNLFGTVSFPNGTFTLNGSQVLAGGVNYFWLVYDVPFTAVINDYLDAQCTSLIVGTARTPATIDPSGNRKISIGYCAAGSQVCDEYIKRVVAGTIDNNTTCSAGGYADYSTLSTTVVPGGNIAVSVYNSIAYVGDLCGIWVDWNHNGDFTDDPAVTVGGNISIFTATITCPADVFTGPKRMRIRIHYTNESTLPCSTAYYGEVEDYTILVTSPGTVPVTGNVPTGTTRCYTALQTVTVAGGGTAYTVQSGGFSYIIAGQKISFLPGTQVFSGGYLHGYISGAPYCYPPVISDVLTGTDNFSPVTETRYCKIWPNPTTGEFTLSLKENGLFSGLSHVEIYGIRGERIESVNMGEQLFYHFSLEGRPAGIYFVRIVNGQNTETFKVVRQN